MTFNRYSYANNNPYKFNDPDGKFINFVAKFVADVAINAAYNYVTTGEANVAGAIAESAAGMLNPAKTVQKVAKLGKAIRSAGRADGPSNATRRRPSAAQRERALERSQDANGVERCTLDRRSGSPNSAEIDHVKAYSRGGETVDENLDAACRTCNKSKGAEELGTEWIPPNER